MTVAELIEKLRDYDPSTLICVLDRHVVPAADELDPAEEINGQHCVVIYSSFWPGAPR